jgi:hypothetical protein
MTPVAPLLGCDGPGESLDVSEEAEVAYLKVESFEEAGVAHPIGEELSCPRMSLGTVVVRSRQAVARCSTRVTMRVSDIGESERISAVIYFT